MLHSFTRFTRMHIAPRLVAWSAASLMAVTVSAQRLALDLTGNWHYKVVTENGTGTPTVTMTQKGDSLRGTYSSGRMGVLPFAGVVKDSTFTFAVNTAGGAVLTFTGIIDDASHVRGDVDFGGLGSATFTGERKP